MHHMIGRRPGRRQRMVDPPNHPPAETNSGPDDRDTVFATWIADRRMLTTWRITTLSIGVYVIARACTGVSSPFGVVPATSLVVVPLGVQALVQARARRRRQRWRSRARPQWAPRGRIDARVDDMLRSGLTVAFRQEHEQLERVIDGIQAQGPDVAREVRDLLVAVNAMALFAVGGGNWPLYGTFKALTASFIAAHPGPQFPPHQVQYFLESLPKQKPPSSVFFSPDTLFTGFAVAAWLLDSAQRPAGMTRWDFFREIEDALGTGEGRVARVRLV